MNICVITNTETIFITNDKKYGYKIHDIIRLDEQKRLKSKYDSFGNINIVVLSDNENISKKQETSKIKDKKILNIKLHGTDVLLGTYSYIKQSISSFYYIFTIPKSKETSGIETSLRIAEESFAGFGKILSFSQFLAGLFIHKDQNIHMTISDLSENQLFIAVTHGKTFLFSRIISVKHLDSKIIEDAINTTINYINLNLSFSVPPVFMCNILTRTEIDVNIEGVSITKYQNIHNIDNLATGVVALLSKQNKTSSFSDPFKDTDFDIKNPAITMRKNMKRFFIMVSMLLICCGMLLLSFSVINALKLNNKYTLGTREANKKISVINKDLNAIKSVANFTQFEELNEIVNLYKDHQKATTFINQKLEPLYNIFESIDFISNIGYSIDINDTFSTIDVKIKLVIKNTSGYNKDMQILHQKVKDTIEARIKNTQGVNLKYPDFQPKQSSLPDNFSATLDIEIQIS